MDQASHQEDSEKPAMQELIQFGILSQIFSSEIETKLFTFPPFWFHIMDMLWMTKLYSELVKEF
jgi:hypothetical protein